MQQKKSLGQNFLRSGSALRTIVDAGKVSIDDIVLEIGPGRGALTQKLLETGATVVAVEKDRELIPLLQEKFADYIGRKKLFLLHDDILNISAEQVFSNFKLKAINYKLIANIPYYITGEIIRKFLEEKNQPKTMVLLVQKEVAERIVARDTKESILSIAVKVYATPRYITKVKKEAFTPVPNVDSAIVAFENISKDFFIQNNITEKDFFTVVKTGFAHKRKKLGGNLKTLIPILNKEYFDTFKDKRAEELSVTDWQNIIL